jgi:hypothetical protein
VAFEPRQNVPQNLHQQQGVNHLIRVLSYAPMVEENGEATVYLTPEDWHVVADTLFNMDTPGDVLPPEIMSFRRGEGDVGIELKTENILITLEMI